MKRNLLILIAILFVICVSSISAYGQTANDVYKSLARIDVTSQTGVGFEEYSRLVTEAMTEQKVFMNFQGKDKPEMVDAFQKIIDKHSLARDYWSSITHKDTSNRARLHKQIQETYPKLKYQNSTKNEYVYHNTVVILLMNEIHKDFANLGIK